MKTQLRILLVVVVLLVVLGMLLVLSASGTYSEMRFNNIYYLFKSHLWKVIAAVAGLVIASMIPYDYYKKYSKYMIFGIVGLLIITFLVAPKLNGASRWINLGFLTFQPSGLAKLVLIIHLAALLERKGELIKDFQHGFRYALFWIFIVCFFVLIQPNVSTSIIIVLSSFALLFVAGARWKHLSYTFGGLAAGGLSAILIFPHARERVIGYINSLRGISEQNTQVLQAKIGLGSGGFLGVGLGHSRQSDLFLPESYSDFIFSVLGEEFGYLGTILVLVLYFVVFFMGILIAKKAKDDFGKLLGFGISFNIILGAFVNAAVVTGLIPTTGITLPFISFGGTSIIIFCISIGILINIARESMQNNLQPIELNNEESK